jgi:apolipoprotein D and lipocalin family protein
MLEALPVLRTKTAHRRNGDLVEGGEAGELMRAPIACILVFCVTAVGAVAQQAGRPGKPGTVAHVDLARYAGQWYEVARFPNRFQNQCVGDVVVFYALRQDGRVDVTNTCRTKDGSRDEAKGVARVVADDGSNARLKVRFAPAFLTWLPMVWGDYWILALADDYSYAIVGDPGRDYLWFLSRTPAISDELYESLRERAAAQGFDVARLQRTINGA